MAYEDNLKEFIDKYREILEAKQNGEDDLQKEFTTLKSQAGKVKQDKATTAGEKQTNFRKNRYKDILPFDETRFVLKTTETSPEGFDYINASYVKGTKCDHAYIAAQGPLPSTVNDFWRLLWESGGSVIIMACNEYEMSKNRTRQHKCERYWAEEGEVKQFDDISVSLIDSDSKKRDYKERVLKAKKGNEEKIFHQFHYTAWPDHGVPDTVAPILELRKKARKYQPDETKPLIIHCSAGCGRTGTIMVLDYIADLIHEKEIPETFSVYDIIMDMRKQRPAIVQSKDQYEFVYRAVSELFKHELSSLGVDYGQNYVNVQIGLLPGPKKPQPRMPPGLPPATVKLATAKPATAKPARPTSGDKSQLSAATRPPPPLKPDPTVYANAAEMQSLANNPPGVTVGARRRSSSRDIKDLNDVQQIVNAQAPSRQEAPSRPEAPSKSEAPSRPDPPKMPFKSKFNPPPVKKERQSDSLPLIKERQNDPVPAKRERQNDSRLSSGSPPPMSKVLIPLVSKNVTQANPVPSMHSPLHKTSGPSPSFDALKENLSVTLARGVNGKANPPGRDRPNFNPPKPPAQKGSTAPRPVSQEEVQRTRVKMQLSQESDYEVVNPTPTSNDSGKSPKGPGRSRNPAKPARGPTRRPSSDSSSTWKDNGLYQSGDRLVSSDNSLLGSSVINVTYQSTEPPMNSPPVNPPPRPTLQQRHNYEPVAAPSPNPPPKATPIKTSTNSSTDYDLVQFQSNGSHLATPVPGSSGTSLSTGVFNPQSRINARSSPQNSSATPPTTKSTNITTGSSHSTTPSHQNDEHAEGNIPTVPQRTADSYIMLETRPVDADDKHGREDKSVNSSSTQKGTLRVIRKLAITKDTLQNLFSGTQSEDAPRPSPPQSQNQHNSPLAFPHRTGKPVGPRTANHMKKPAQVGRGHTGVIPMN